MRNALALILCCGIAAAHAAEKTGAGGGDVWLTDLQQATAAATKTNHLIMADFTGSDWCGWCKKLKSEVFDTPEFKKWAAEHVVLLEVDFPQQKPQSDALKKQNEALSQKFGVTGFPTIIFMDDKGNKVGEAHYEAGGPSVWIPKAEEAVAGHKAH